MLNRTFKQAIEIQTFQIKEEDGLYRRATKDEIVKAAKSIMDEGFSKMDCINNPEKTLDFLKLQLADIEHEIFAAIWLNSKHQPLGFEELFKGSINGASIYPREVVKAALANNASAVIFAHNHPSGRTDPSTADQQITETLRKALDLIDVRVLDHVIVGEKTTSFAQLGLL